MIKIITKFLIPIAIFSMLVLPVVLMAQEVGDCSFPDGGEGGSGFTFDQCTSAGGEWSAGSIDNTSNFSTSTNTSQNSSGSNGRTRLVPCTNTPTVSQDGKTVTYDEPCDFNALMDLINRIIKFILFVMAVPICAIMFCYAGILMVTSGGSTEARGKAKGIFTSAVVGLAIAAGGWLVIRTLLSILGYDGSWIGL